jgi:hypothetical protein
MEKINFSDCTLALLEDKFGLQPQRNLPDLTKWIKTAYTLSDTHTAVAYQLSQNLQDNALHWNEQDLSMHFIGPMFSLVGFTERERFNLFAQSTITATVQDCILTGRVDELIASGFRTPKIPFFAFSEYKKETDSKGEPAGQALAAMLAGKALNNTSNTIYGCYIIGSIWRFMLLIDNEYAISTSFDGAELEDATQILRILFQLKEYCMQRTEPIINL